MNKYFIWNTRANICVAEYESDTAKNTFDVDPAYVGSNYETRDITGTVIPVLTNVIVWTALEFLQRFTVSERISIRALAKTDPVIEDFMDLLNKAANVHSDDESTLQGLQYLQTLGVISLERKNAILGV